MASRDELQKLLLTTFREEAAEHVQALDGELRGILSGPVSQNRQRLETMFRVMHTLKGAARSVRFHEIEKLCQESETLLRDLVRGEMNLTDANTATLKHSTERLQGLVFEGLSRSAALGTGPAPAGADSAGAAASDHGPDAETGAPRDDRPLGGQKSDGVSEQRFESVRVNVGRLDRLILVAEDLLLPSLVTAERVRAAKGLTEDVRLLRAGTRAFKSTPADARPRAELLDALKEIEAKSRRLMLALADDQRTLRTSVNELFREARNARMVPAAAMLAAFPAMVQDLAKETGKQAKWRLKDSGTELDRKVIELVKDPLIHLVRNAVDHGIEPPDEREAAGKPRRGRITVTIATLEGSRVAIKIADDGRGMNLKALKDAAVRARSVTASQVKSLSDDEVLDLAFRPGVSTSSVISSISGLGLGLAIAREQMERIDGSITIETAPGQGTTIALELPASIASFRGLLVTAGKVKLLWPADSVERAIGVPKAAAIAAVQSGLLSHGNETLPVGRLSSAMAIQAQDLAIEERRLLPCVIVSSGSRRAAFLVDEILGETDVLVKDLPSPLRRVRHISSAGLLASGDLALVLRPSDLLATVQTLHEAVVAPVQSDSDRSMRVLVVDDSITTRTMERNLLEAAGYSVTVAADGLDAWSVLQAEPIDIVVSDIDMPRMNGFDLTSRIRADPRLADLPVVLVTALESRDDKERGIRIGANAYVLKSAFDQSNLLEIVGRLI
jgi:two-component system chemotaxis sensor kinase CheA